MFKLERELGAALLEVVALRADRERLVEALAWALPFAHHFTMLRRQNFGMHAAQAPQADQERARESLEKRELQLKSAERLLALAGKPHVRVNDPETEDDACRRCGLDLRHECHSRAALDAARKSPSAPGEDEG